MTKYFEYKVIDYVNINHHNNEEVEINLNQLGKEGFELIYVLDLGENNTNKDGKTSRYRYILKKSFQNGN